MSPETTSLGNRTLLMSCSGAPGYNDLIRVRRIRATPYIYPMPQNVLVLLHVLLPCSVVQCALSVELVYYNIMPSPSYRVIEFSRGGIHREYLLLPSLPDRSDDEHMGLHV